MGTESTEPRESARIAEFRKRLDEIEKIQKMILEWIQTVENENDEFYFPGGTHQGVRFE